MTLEQLAAFIAVAERAHLTRAAEALHLSPSAVSTAVRTLEARYQVQLFHRMGRGIALSAAGHHFLPIARATLAQARLAEAALGELGTLDRGDLVVHASQTIANYWLPARLAAFRRRFARVDIDLRVGNSATVARAVGEGSAELGFVEGSIEEPHLTAMPIARDRLVVVMPKTVEAARDPQSRAWQEVLPALDWILRESGSGTRAMFEDGLRALGIDPSLLRVSLTLPSNEAVLTAVRTGANCATALSETVVAPFLARGDLALLDVPLPPRDFVLLHHAQRPLSGLARAFSAICRDEPGARA